MEVEFYKKVKVNVNISKILISIPVKYGEDDIPDDFPLRNGENWSAMVNVDTGEIEDFPLGIEASFFMKVTDRGIYKIFDDFGTEVSSIVQDYVPHGVIPGEYGDYVHLKISKGIITNWPKNPDFSEFFEEDED